MKKPYLKEIDTEILPVGLTPSCIDVQCRPAEKWLGFHQHFHVEMNYVITGYIHLLHGGNLIHIPEGRLTVFWAAIPHQIIDKHPDLQFIYVHLPLPDLLRWRIPPDFLELIMQGGFAIEPDIAYAPYDLLLHQQWINDLSSGKEENKDALYRELEARIYRLAITSGHTVAHREAQNGETDIHNHHANHKVVKMVQYITQHYTDNIDVAEVAGAVDIHPNYASTLFRQKGGVSMMEYVNFLRIAHAQLLLTTTNKTVLDIAFESGFGSLGHFYKVFKQACGQPPCTYRDSIQSFIL